MFKLSELFSRAKPESIEGALNDTSDTNALTAVRSWYEERYESLIVQRNLLMVMLCVTITIIVVAILAVAKIATSKEFDPFVIQIEEQTGETKIVNPLNSDILSGNEALTQYFIKKYIIARETYNPVDFASSARTTVRLLSSPEVFGQYRGWISNKDNDPAAKYGQKDMTYLTIKSWSKLDLDKTKYVVRFSIRETNGGKVYSKIAIIGVTYVPMELKDVERDINPVGFEVTGYKVDDDNS